MSSAPFRTKERRRSWERRLAWTFHPAREAKKSARRARKAMRPDRVILRLFFGANPPSAKRIMNEITAPKQVARMSMNHKTGRGSVQGIRQTPNGWQMTPKKQRAKSVQAQRIAAIQQHNSQATGAVPAKTGTPQYKQKRNGKMNGSTAAAKKTSAGPTLAQTQRKLSAAEKRANQILGW